jgi:hypothetical protein
MEILLGPKINPLNAELNPICHLLALLGAHLIFNVSRIRVNVDVPMKSNIHTMNGTLTVQPISSTLLTQLSWPININKPNKYNILNRLLP